MEKIAGFLKSLTPTQWIIIGIIILIIIVIIIYNKNKATAATVMLNKNAGVSASNDLNKNVAVSTPVSPFPLQYGSKGNEVKTLQAYLNANYNEALVLDGIWGPKTGAAVLKDLGVSSVTTGQYDSTITKA